MTPYEVESSNHSYDMSLPATIVPRTEIRYSYITESAHPRAKTIPAYDRTSHLSARFHWTKNRGYGTKVTSFQGQGQG